MSLTLLNFSRSFLAERLTAEVFSVAYMELWKIERDNGILQLDDPELNACLFSIFCASDMYAPEGVRDEFEFDDEMLRKEVLSLVREIVND